jgi:hypothetical protein
MFFLDFVYRLILMKHDVSEAGPASLCRQEKRLHNLVDPLNQLSLQFFLELRGPATALSRKF